MEKVGEILEEAYTSDELLHHWMSAENKAFKANMFPGDQPQNATQWVLSGSSRNTVIAFLRNFTNWIQEKDSWALAAVLVDSYCCRKGRGSAEEVLSPDVAAACAILAAKHNNQACVHRRSADVSTLVAFLAQCHPEAVTVQRIKQAEMHVLQVLDWRTNVTAVPEWCISFLRRLAALTGREDIAYRATQVMGYWSEYFTSQVASTEALPPKSLATGAFALTLMYTGLLYPDACRPEDVELSTWDALPVISSAYQAIARNSEDPNTQSLEPCSVSNVAIAARCSIRRLQQDVHASIVAFNAATP
jgi:hypothetical protein